MKGVPQRNRIMQILRVARFYLLLAAVIISLTPTRASARQPISLSCIAKEIVAVPFLIIGDQVLIGSAQIPAELPGLIDQYLNAGGVDYPDLQPVKEDLANGQADTLPDETAVRQPVSNGFTLAILILVGMLISLAYTGVVFVYGAGRRSITSRQGWWDYVIPLLAVLGLGVASYLAYVETQAVPAVCGPVGDCNAVQSSSYARLFGILPIGVLGAVGYTLILALWVWAKLRPDRTGQVAALGIFVMALFGTFFSLYLTYLEPFVIRAVCIWCLSSAVLITLLLLVSIRPALGFWSLDEI